MRHGKLFVYVTPYYPPFGAGGAELTASLHARLLIEQGHSVLVVTPNYGAAESEIIDGVEVARHAFARLGSGEQVTARRFASAAYQRRLAREIVRAARGREVFCVHSQHQYVVRGSAAAAIELGAPLVAHLRDTSQICSLGSICLLEPEIDIPPREGCGIFQQATCHQTRYVPTYFPGRSRLEGAARLAPAMLGWMEWHMRGKAFDQAARIAFASDGLRHLYEVLPPFRSKERNFTVYAPVFPPSGHADLSKLPSAVGVVKNEGRPMVLYVGKVSRGKGCDVLFAAWREVVKTVPDACLVVAGNIDQSAWDIDLAHTVLTGFVDRVSVDALYAAADVVVMPSTWPEPLGWATLDAARNGKPIVATRVGGVPEAVRDGRTGVVVPRLDAPAMATAIETLLRNPRQAAAMGGVAAQVVNERFGPAAVTSQLLSLYENL